MLSWCKWLLVCNDFPRGIWGVTEIVLIELYIILVYEKFYLFYLFELSMDQESSFV